MSLATTPGHARAAEAVWRRSRSEAGVPPVTAPPADSIARPGPLADQAASSIRTWHRLPAPARWSLVLAGAVGIQLLRRPETLLRPEFFNEDGQVFYIGTYFGTPLQTILRPYAGYLHLLPRLVALLSRLAPVADAPLVTNTAALLVTAAVVAYVASGRLADAIPSARLRWAIAGLIVFLPNSHETLGSIAYAQWYLAIYLVAAAFATPPCSRLGETADLLTIAGASLTGPWGLLMAPVYAWHARPQSDRSMIDAIVHPARGHWHWRWDGVRVRRGLAVSVPALIQLGYILVTPVPTIAHQAATVADVVGSIGNAFVDASFLGTVWTAVIAHASPPLAVMAGLTVGIGSLIVITVRALSVRELVLVLYVLGVSVATTVARAGATLGGFFDPAVAERYIVVPGLVLGAVAVAAVIRGRGAPRAAGMVLVALLTFGIVGDFRVPPHPSLDWPQRSQCIGGSAPCVVPVQEQALWSIRWPGAGGTYVQEPLGFGP